MKLPFVAKTTDMGPHNTIVVPTLGIDQPDGTRSQNGRDWFTSQVLRHDDFLLSVVEGYRSAESISYTRQVDYIKVNFWLGGKHTTVLNGFGQYEHDRPEAFITAGPWDMIKVDLCSRDVHLASVALCIRRDFFPNVMGVALDDLPEPLRTLFTPEASPFAFHRFSLTRDLVSASRSILTAPTAVRREPIYVQAKAIELMCLLINHMHSPAPDWRVAARVNSRTERGLHAARDLLQRHYSQPLTLEGICREVGLNKMALTSGFRRLFGMSVHDCLQRIRMERALELLHEEGHSISSVALQVGYRHACNFSTAFHTFFGCSPQKIRSGRHAGDAATAALDSKD